jgi:hypothetical protein
MASACPIKHKAKLNGDKFYDTGNPCVNGHYSRRYVSNGACEECCKKQRVEWHSKNREYHNQLNKEWHIKNPERSKKQNAIRCSKRQCKVKKQEFILVTKI